MWNSGPAGTIHVISSSHRFILNNIGALTVLVAVATSVAAGFFLPRWAWRKVITPLDTGPEHSAAPEAPAAAAPSPAGVGAWKIAAAVIVAVVALNCVLVVLAFRPALLKPPAASENAAMLRPVFLGSPFVASLPQGTIELVAVARHPSTDEVWWSPDGNPAREGPFKVEGVSVNADGGMAREFVIRMAGLPAGASEPVWEFEGGGSRATGGRPSLAARSLPDMRQAAVQFSSAAHTANLKIGFGWGAWETLCSEPGTSGSASSSHDREGHTWQVSFSQPTEKAGSAMVTVAHSVKEWETRVVAVDKEGQEHASSGSNSGGEAFEQQTATFSQLPLEDVSEFRFQVRPYRWVEFRNVSLEPGQPTQVEIVDAKDERHGG
jgi:hypothetical protein